MESRAEDRWGEIGEHPWSLDFVVHLCGLLKLDEKQTSETLHAYVKKYGLHLSGLRGHNGWR